MGDCEMVLNKNQQKRGEKYEKNRHKTIQVMNEEKKYVRGSEG